jgi:2-methylisocitrate lyase-like PEP mutase family enzyme
MMISRHSKVERFQALHARPGAFVIPNPWDAGTARILAQMGYEALATTSAGYAFTQGLLDSAACLSREGVLANAKTIVQATDLPVSADLEDGFGARPEDCVATIRAALDIGLAGGSIEDATGNPAQPIYDFGLSVERVAAAAEEARKHGFIFTARAENFLHGNPDLDDTIRRLQAFERAGADVLYAPGLKDLASIGTVCRSISKPVNVVMGLVGPVISLAELEQAGVKRISVGGSMARAALGAFIRAAQEVKEKGTFDYAAEAISAKDIARYMAWKAR